MSFSPFHHRSRLRFGILFAALAVAVHGQDPSPSQFTMPDALQRAAADNPSLTAQRIGERSAEALIQQANSRPNPTLDVTFENFAGTGATQAIDRLESTVQANQTFERGGKREKRVAVARREYEVTVHELSVRRTEILGGNDRP